LCRWWFSETRFFQIQLYSPFGGEFHDTRAAAAGRLGLRKDSLERLAKASVAVPADRSGAGAIGG
jgi:hypothetical protein